jgi:hypothetical protein
VSIRQLTDLAQDFGGLVQLAGFRITLRHIPFAAFLSRSQVRGPERCLGESEIERYLSDFDLPSTGLHSAEGTAFGEPRRSGQEERLNVGERRWAALFRSACQPGFAPFDYPIWSHLSY